jgi:hypothetical protein
MAYVRQVQIHVLCQNARERKNYAFNYCHCLQNVALTPNAVISNTTFDESN